MICATFEEVTRKKTSEGGFFPHNLYPYPKLNQDFLSNEFITSSSFIYQNECSNYLVSQKQLKFH